MICAKLLGDLCTISKQLRGHLSSSLSASSVQSKNTLGDLHCQTMEDGSKGQYRLPILPTCSILFDLKGKTQAKVAQCFIHGGHTIMEAFIINDFEGKNGKNADLLTVTF